MTEDFDELPYPPDEMCVDITEISLGALGGSLCLVCNYLNDHTHKNYRIDIWIIKEYKVKESWTMLFTVKPGNVISDNYLLTPFASLKSCDQMVFHQGGYILCNLQRRRAKSVRLSGVGSYDFTYSCVGSHVALDDVWNNV